MIRTSLLALLFFLPATPMHAQDEAPSLLVVSCDNEQSNLHVEIATASDPVWNGGPKATVEKIDFEKLVRYSKEDKQGNSYRTGSKSLSRTCGQLRLEITAGFFNSNPQGHLGAEPDYPVIELFKGKSLILGPLAIGSCDKSEFSQPECPGGWATEMFANGRDQPYIELDHDYREQIDVSAPGASSNP